MTFSTFEDIKNLDNESLLKTIESTKKDLFDLRL